MEQCLMDNKICAADNLNCDCCRLKDCRETIKMIDEVKKYEEEEDLRKIRKELPEPCKKCHMLIITSIKEKKVYCPYLIKEECLAGGKMK